MNLYGQQMDTFATDKKYEAAYKYVSIRQNLGGVGKLFKKLPTNNYPPNVLSEVYPISIMMLGRNAINHLVRSDTGNLANRKGNEFILLYDKQHYFKPIKYSFGDRALKNRDSQLYLVFSKLGKDYLLAELHIDYYKNKPSNYHSFSKIGSYYMILFIFDGKDTVKKIFCNQVNQ